MIDRWPYKFGILAGIVGASGGATTADFVSGSYPGGTFADLLTFTRASQATDLLPTDPAGYSYTTYANDVPRFRAGRGFLMENTSRTNILAAPTAPATQTVALAVGIHVLWVNGTGSATIAFTTAVGGIGKTGTLATSGVATNGNPVFITCTTAGNVSVTVTGSLQAFQLEAVTAGRPAASSFIPFQGARALETNQMVGPMASMLIGSVGVGGSGTAIISYEILRSCAFFSSAIQVGGALGPGANDEQGNNNNSAGGDAIGAATGTGTLFDCKQGVAWDATTRGQSLNGGLCTIGGSQYVGGGSTTIRLGVAGFMGFIRRVDAYSYKMDYAALRRATQLVAPEVVALGDSLTGRADGLINFDGNKSGISYPARLGTLMGKVVLNGGKEGDTTAQMLARYQNHPDLWSLPLVIGGGWNDIAGAVSAATSVANIQAIAALNTSGKVIVTGTINGYATTEASGTGRYTSTIALQSALATAFGANFVDIRQAIVNAYDPANPADVLLHATDQAANSQGLPRAAQPLFLTAAIDATQTTMSFNVALGSTGPWTVQIENEFIRVTAMSGANVTASTRNYGTGGTAAAHAANIVARVVPDGNSPHLGDEVGRPQLAAAIKAKIDTQWVLGPTTASFATSATAGTTIATFTGLGPGETVVSVSPNDGRIAIGGGGATATVGLTASSAGTISYTFTTSAGRTLGISITASAVGGTAKTTFAQTPTIQMHPNTSTITVQPTTSVTATVTNRTMVISSNTGPAIIIGDIVNVPGFPGLMVTRITGAWAAKTGTFTLSQDCGSLGSVTVTYDSNAVISISDVSGNGWDFSTPDIYGPRVRTDALGRKFLRFLIPEGGNGAWLRNLSITNTDTYNATWLFAGRIHSPVNQTFVSHGAKELSSGVASGGQLSTIQAVSGTTGLFPRVHGSNWTYPTNPANTNKMFLGNQLQVFGSAFATDDGVGGASTTHAAQVMVNEQVVTTTGGGRWTGVTGVEIGKNSSQPTGNAGTSGYSFMDVYEITGFLTGQHGTRTQMPGRVATAVAAMQTNWAIPTITDSVIMLGDSRFKLQTDTPGAVGRTVGLHLTDPGATGALPASTRVINMAVTGQGIGKMWQYFDAGTPYANYVTPMPLLASMMLGGGHDQIVMLSGINDLYTLWPGGTAAGTGAGASNSAAQADDMYNGADYTASFTGTIANNDVNMSVTGKTGNLYSGSRITMTGVVPGQAASGYSAAGPFPLFLYQTPAVTAVSGTAVLSSYQKFVQAALTRGFKVLWLGEPWYATPDGAGTAQLRSKVMNNAIADVTTAIGSTLAANLKVLDLSQITVGGVKPFGANYTTALTDQNYNDGIHFTPLGQSRLVSGGDNIADGIGWALTH